MSEPVLHSFIFAQILGLYLIILAVIVLSRGQYYREMILKIKSPGIGIFQSAGIWLLLGIFLVDMHNRWAMKPYVLITIFCWAILIKSILWLSIPQRMLAFAQKVVATKLFYVVIVFWAVFGVLLLTKGFWILSIIAANDKMVM